MSEADLTAFDVLLKETVTAKRLSGSKVTELQSMAMKLLKHDTRLVASMYKLHRSLRPKSQQKISSLYVFDGIARAARGVLSKAQKAGTESSDKGAVYATAFLGRVEAVLGGLVGDMVADGWTEGREKAKKILSLWTSSKTFPPATLERLQGVVAAAAAAADNNGEGSSKMAAAAAASSSLARPATGRSGSGQARKSASPDGYPTTPPPDQRSTTPPGPPPAQLNYGPRSTTSAAPPASAPSLALPTTSFLDPKLLENLASIAANANKLAGTSTGVTPPHSAGLAITPVPPSLPPVSRSSYNEPPRDPRLPPPRPQPASPATPLGPGAGVGASANGQSSEAQMQAALARRDQIAAMMSRSAGGLSAAGQPGPPQRPAPPPAQAPPQSQGWQNQNGPPGPGMHPQDVRAQLHTRDVRAAGYGAAHGPAHNGAAPQAKRPAGGELSDGEVEMDMEDSEDEDGLKVGRGAKRARMSTGPGTGAGPATGGVQISLSAHGQSIASSAPPARPPPPSASATAPAPPPTNPPGPSLDTFDVSSFNPMSPASWAALGDAWRTSKRSEPTAQELMGFLMGSPAGMQAMMGGMGGMSGMGMGGDAGMGMGMGMGAGMGGMGAAGGAGQGAGAGAQWQQDDSHQQVRGSWDDGPYAQFGRGRGR